MLVAAENAAFLVFRLADQLYGINAELVAEVFRLPAITPIEEAPGHVVGMINWRGHVTPIIDLHLRMGRSWIPPLLSDAIVIVHYRQETVGILVNEILEVRPIDPAQIEPSPRFADEGHHRHPGGCGALRPPVTAWVVQIDDDLVTLLDPARLMPSPIAGIAIELDDQPGPESLSDGTAKPGEWPELAPFLHHFSPGERQILDQRAKRLRTSLREWDVSTGTALAVVELHQELLGIDLRQIRGFAKIRHPAPIPCCPSHVLGCMNLRGDILTLIDISNLLGIPSRQDGPPTQALVVEYRQGVLGVAVHQVRDVIHLHPGDLARAPAPHGPLKREHLRGAAAYGQSMFSFLDLEQILTSPELVVQD